MDNPYLFERIIKCCADGFAIGKDYKSIRSLALVSRATHSIINPILIEVEDIPTEIEEDGSQYWYKNEYLHRDGDKPAVIGIDESQYWFKNGELHRDGDNPAIIYADGSQHWYRSGKKHRDGDKPAVVDSDGTEEFWRHGERYYL